MSLLTMIIFAYTTVGTVYGLDQHMEAQKAKQLNVPQIERQVAMPDGKTITVKQ